jgi:threonine synthase
MRTHYVLHLRCSRCRKTVSFDAVRTFCPECAAPYVVEYDIDVLRRIIRRETFAGRDRSLWRYREMLPVEKDESVVTLGEGWTPLLRLPALGRDVGIPNLWMKDEGFNPTGSFKSRGIAVAVTRGVELGISVMGMPSAGNAGGALAAYAARAGIKSEVWVPAGTPAVNIAEVSLYGGTVRLVNGDISDAGAAMRSAAHPEGWFDLSTMKEPYRLEGKKTMGYEIAEQSGWTLPDAIVYPTGGGTGLIGIWKAVLEMEALGLIAGRKPRMVCVQAAGCQPVVTAFRKGRTSTEFFKGARTIASGLRVPKAFADTMILDVVRESGGTAISVTDEEIRADMARVAGLEGCFLCPEGAAAVAGVRKLAIAGTLRPGERVVILNTGTGYKYTELYL